ncbi:GntR family transcriptional regulator/MocR family aminotransferase [Saccharothrix tamanrassetensis]|uniref:GntR family transcriptional regulator/MocR family aminotransferase n=1 Tax=Saccharothrix tamanrassetensis TaxID=1051531 RepID=A0A841CGY3_9PSEU|nr:PLP-dependent aminotransferase family protein [Saccharothrix tamanrassetensis]MBB5956253.1 GntR family transcriptional regulator/MocR family aminotransferase [Saccharothrix tamanrassetensis]
MTANWTTYRELLLPGLTGRRAVESELRRAVRDGRLQPGTRLPSSRDLADQLGVARGTVTSAYAQLIGEGYLVAKRGSGTTVTAACTWPNTFEQQPRQSPRWQFDLRPGVPALSAFPRDEWLQAQKTALLALTTDELGYPDPAGFPLLRKELADYLGRVRAVATRPSEVVVVNGAAEGISLLGRVLKAAGHTGVAIEEPSHFGAADMLASHGLVIRPIPVDDRGIRVDELSTTDSRAVLVTAAHQFPLGVVLHPERRRALLDWARARDGLVIEDDYDAEHRYDRPAMGAMQALDPTRVVYQGSASKVLAPALRLGWLVLPPDLRDTIVERKRLDDLGTGTLHQAAFAQLLRTGGYDRHLRRTRQLYRARRDALLDALSDELPAWTPIGVAAGLHVVLRLPDGTDDLALQERLARRGVNAPALANYARSPTFPGLVLGYAALTPDRLRQAVRELREASDPRP